MNSITLDWIALTIKELKSEPETTLLLIARDTATYPSDASNGYDTAIRTTGGISAMWHSSRAEMGFHVVISGTALRDLLTRSGLSQREILRQLSDLDGRFTRLDIAKDVTDVPIDLDRIYEAVSAGKNRGTARTFSQMHSPNGGNTVYVGSRTSERFIRIYDKASQNGTFSKQWKRFEIECKGMVARAMASMLIKSENWDGVFNDFALAMLTLNECPDYMAFFDGNTSEVGFPKIEKKSDRELWIMEQVTPAVVKHFVEFPDSEAIKHLRQMLDLIDRQQK
jgi:phage replication initiation protein